MLSKRFTLGCLSQVTLTLPLVTHLANAGDHASGRVRRLPHLAAGAKLLRPGHDPPHLGPTHRGQGAQLARLPRVLGPEIARTHFCCGCAVFRSVPLFFLF